MIYLSTIPEPVSLSLLALGGFTLIRRRRKVGGK
ncbi:MAG: PEP-CTERM sorting domain-containing protein [Sedimentisphaerales bacterium]|nr:PEP-CTERM sorting domain-containing protein [Sedimentisphaerales bacterium]